MKKIGVLFFFAGIFVILLTISQPANAQTASTGIVLGSVTDPGGSSVPDAKVELTNAARTLAKAGALMAIEGPNEPNNFLITYNGKQGGGADGSWLPVAELQRDLYSAVKNDPELKQYPVFHVSEGGAETENVGLQFLTIPAGAKTLLPDGTRYADYANPHNYVVGIGIGLFASWVFIPRLFFSRLLMNGVQATDPIAFLGAALVVFGAALAASYIPARRATRLDPIAALRYE